MDFGKDFVELEFGSARLHLNKVLAPQAATIAFKLRALGAEHRPGTGNRASAFRLKLDGAPDLFVRCSRRGGLVQFVLSDLYLGPIPRPFRELSVTLEARRRGIALAEPMGAMVDWIAPMVYRGYFLTRAMEGKTLWEFVRSEEEPAVRGQVLDQARRVIEAMRERGLFHADLNLHNLFVTRVAGNFTVVILDLDKARLYPPPLTAGLSRAIRARLARSARKLDPVGRYLDSYALSRLDIA